MALQKTITDARGISVNYWRVSDVNISAEGLIDVRLESYLDATARIDKAPIATDTYQVSGADYTTYFAPAVLDVVSQNPQERAYVWLKTQTTPVDFTTGTTDV